MMAREPERMSLRGGYTDQFDWGLLGSFILIVFFALCVGGAIYMVQLYDGPAHRTVTVCETTTRGNFSRQVCEVKAVDASR